jgi:hypothetical protein
MTEHHAKATVGEGGTVTVRGLPLAPGANVDVIVRSGNGVQPSLEKVREMLRGSVLRYEDPFGPAVPPEDWDALR